MFKILMLGHTGVGKTTYMTSLYGIMQENINGFSLNAHENKFHQFLISAFLDVQKDKYPLPTSFRESYDFNLMLNNQPVFPELGNPVGEINGLHRSGYALAPDAIFRWLESL
jgi:GTPase SAR1 family protein